MRGKRDATEQQALEGRNIPAYAGKTPGGPAYPQDRAEHPRVCGENRVINSSDKSAGGTSPRMRGKLTLYHWGFTHDRNIPAYAGKTRARRLPQT